MLLSLRSNLATDTLICLLFFMQITSIQYILIFTPNHDIKLHLVAKYIFQYLTKFITILKLLHVLYYLEKNKYFRLNIFFCVQISKRQNKTLKRCSI